MSGTWHIPRAGLGGFGCRIVVGLPETGGGFMGDQSLDCQIMLMLHNVAERYRFWAIGLTWLSVRHNVRSF